MNQEYKYIVAPKNYPGKLYLGKYCYEHHYVYWENTGDLIDNKHQIHHIDSNKHNNDFNNLKLVSKSSHAQSHMNKSFAKYVLLKCPICNKVFPRIRRYTHVNKSKQVSTSCCRTCSGLFSNKIMGEDKRLNIFNNVVLLFEASQNGDLKI